MTMSLLASSWRLGVFAVGSGLVVRGVASVSEAAAYMVAGVMLMAVAVAPYVRKGR